jgi:hypothetical protein
MLRHNQPTLKERLVDLVERVGEEEVERFLPDVPLWAKAVKDTRNRFAHHDPEQDTREFPAEGVLALAETTAAVTTLCLLQQLGLQQAVIQRVVERHAHYRWLARLARELPDWMASATRG